MSKPKKKSAHSAPPKKTAATKGPRVEHWTPQQLRRIQLEQGTQVPARGIKSETVAEYRDAMERGAEFPPSVVFHDDSRLLHIWWGGDHHRVAAALEVKRRGFKLAVEIREGGKDDARLYAAGANSDHGRPRTDKEKWSAVETVLGLPACKRWSNRRIAEHVDVSHPFVAKVRDSLEMNSSGGGKRIDKRNRVIDTTNIEKANKKKAAKEKKPGPEEKKPGPEEKKPEDNKPERKNVTVVLHADNPESPVETAHLLLRNFPSGWLCRLDEQIHPHAVKLAKTGAVPPSASGGSA